MALEIKDPATGQIKTWVWIAMGVVGVAIFFLISRAGGSANNATAAPAPNVAGGQSSDITDYLNQLESSLQDIAGNSNVPVTTTQPPAPNPTNPGQLQDIIDQLKEGNKVLEQAQQNLLSLLNQQSTLQNQFSTAEAQRADLITKREHAQARINDLKIQYKSGQIGKKFYTSHVASWEKSLKTYNTQISTLDKTIAGIKTSISNVQNQIASINTSLS
jgi:DNA repair exonuclease SbcCD ATPase subunit